MDASKPPLFPAEWPVVFAGALGLYVAVNPPTTGVWRVVFAVLFFGLTMWALVATLHQRNHAEFQRRQDREMADARHKELLRQNAEMLAELRKRPTPAGQVERDALAEIVREVHAEYAKQPAPDPTVLSGQAPVPSAVFRTILQHWGVTEPSARAVVEFVGFQPVVLIEQAQVDKQDAPPSKP